MAQGNELDKETFLRIVAMSGLDPKDPHIEELYPYVLAVRRSLAPLNKLNIPHDTEPAMLFIHRKE